MWCRWTSFLFKIHTIQYVLGLRTSITRPRPRTRPLPILRLDMYWFLLLDLTHIMNYIFLCFKKYIIASVVALPFFGVLKFVTVESIGTSGFRARYSSSWDFLLNFLIKLRRRDQGEIPLVGLFSAGWPLDAFLAPAVRQLDYQGGQFGGRSTPIYSRSSDRKKSKHFVSYKYFPLVLGLLKSRISEKSFELLLRKPNNKLFHYKARLQPVSKITTIATRNRC